jgi:hypothetical protein
VALDTIDGHGEGPKKKKHKSDEKESAEEE